MKITQILFDFKKVGELTKQYSNLPDSYIKRSMERIVYKTPRLPNYLPRNVGRKKILFTKDRPWTLNSQLDNPLFSRVPTVFVEPIKDWAIFKGDRVEILDGKDKGKQGIVCQVIQERNWVIVEGLNCKLVTNKDKNGKLTYVMQEENPLRVTDQVALVDPSDLLPCKVEWRYTEMGERVRISLRTGREIPLSRMANQTYDYKSKDTYKENLKDTVESELVKITFEPKLCTFEMDIMKANGIEENRDPQKFYWY